MDTIESYWKNDSDEKIGLWEKKKKEKITEESYEIVTSLNL